MSMQIIIRIVCGDVIMNVDTFVNSSSYVGDQEQRVELLKETVQGVKDVLRARYDEGLRTEDEEVSGGE